MTVVMKYHAYFHLSRIYFLRYINYLLLLTELFAWNKKYDMLRTHFFLVFFRLWKILVDRVIEKFSFLSSHKHVASHFGRRCILYVCAVYALAEWKVLKEKYMMKNE